MKSKYLLVIIFSITTLFSCSSDSDKSDVNYIKAKINGVDLKFNIISVDIEDYTEYKDIIISATMESDPTKSIIIASQYDVTVKVKYGDVHIIPVVIIMKYKMQIHLFQILLKILVETMKQHFQEI